MYSIIKASTLILMAISAFLIGITGCEPKSITIVPEHITLEELNQKLNDTLNSTLTNQPNEEQNNTLNIQNSTKGLILTGDSVSVAKAVSLAQQLDKPHNYYLEIRNTPINSISTLTETMRILLHPEHPVIFGQIALVDGPWQALIKDKQRILELMLSKDLVLSIDIKSQQDHQVGFYSGKYPMALNTWIVAFDESGMNPLGTNQRKKITASRPGKQLWLRLIKADSQSEINLR
jgi:hypothetical protein